jgi:hypothetical protein
MTSARTTAAAEGAAWSSAASGWVEHWAGSSSAKASSLTASSTSASFTSRSRSSVVTPKSGRAGQL